VILETKLKHKFKVFNI